MLADQIRQVRSFNRTVTQRVGALGASFLDRGRPLGEARLIYEIGVGGADVKELRERLALDSGYLSRLLRSLDRQGLVRLRNGAEDARVRHVALTPEGRNELTEYDRRSDAFAQSILASLSTAQRDRLVSAMTDVERLLRAAAVEIRIEKPDSADAVWCLDQYSRELAQRFEGGYDPNQTRAVSTGELTPPAGCFLVARLDGRPIGCGALKVGPDNIAEIKRIWVLGAVRGLGVGRRILQTLEENAWGYGAALLRLDTNRALKEAQALYRATGYREVAPFNDEPYAHHWFEKTLRPISASPSPPRAEGEAKRRPPARG